MRGIILAGGSGSRLLPLTRGINKHVLPVYDKPMIYYPLSTLMLMGFKRVTVVSSPSGVPQLRVLLGDGSDLGMSIDYVSQPEPTGVAGALRCALADHAVEPVTVVLGDNLFFGVGLGSNLMSSIAQDSSTVFTYLVKDASSFGVVEYDQDRAVRIVEKPSFSGPDWAVTGLYVYSREALQTLGDVRPSTRGELEISDVNDRLLAAEMLDIVKLPRGTAWLDMGSPEDLYAAAQFVRILQERQELLIGSPEEIAWRNGWISDTELERLAVSYGNVPYARFLGRLVSAHTSRP